MEYIESAAPSQDLRIGYLERTASCPGLPDDLRAEIDSLILQQEPTRVAPVLREAQRLMTRDRKDQAIALLERALEDHADAANLWLALIRAQLNAGNPEEARLVLEQAKSVGLGTPALLEAQARVEAALGQTDEMRATITRVRGQSRGESRLVASSFMLEGELEALLGNIDEALTAYAAADAASPATPALQRAAALALESGRPAQARRMYRTLCLREPGGSACAREARLAKETREAPP